MNIELFIQLIFFQQIIKKIPILAYTTGSSLFYHLSLKNICRIRDGYSLQEVYFLLYVTPALLVSISLTHILFLCRLIISRCLLHLLPDLGMQLSTVHLRVFNPHLKQIGKKPPNPFKAFYFLCLHCFLCFFYKELCAMILSESYTENELLTFV